MIVNFTELRKTVTDEAMARSRLYTRHKNDVRVQTYEGNLTSARTPLLGRKALQISWVTHDPLKAQTQAVGVSGDKTIVQFDRAS